MKNNENRKHVAEISAPVAEKPATLPNSATAETSAKAVNPIAAELPTEQADTVSAAADSGKIPPLDLGEARLTPVTAPIVSTDSPDPVGSDVAAAKVEAPMVDADAAIKAIAAAMDIDTRIAHALVDIHAGVDTAEAFARAYGVTLPAKKNEAETRPAQAVEAKSPEAETSAAIDTSAARLPEQAASVPTFLCNPRRGFWD